MKTTITINMDNSAFCGDDGYGPELAHILRMIAQNVEYNRDDEVQREILDSNGNHVGTLKIHAR